MHAGLGRAFQTQLFPRLSVHENVRLALQSRQQGLLAPDPLLAHLGRRPRP